jgi:hypothetical protein
MQYSGVQKVQPEYPYCIAYCTIGPHADFDAVLGKPIIILGPTVLIFSAIEFFKIRGVHSKTHNSPTGRAMVNTS